MSPGSVPGALPPAGSRRRHDDDDVVAARRVSRRDPDRRLGARYFPLSSRFSYRSCQFDKRRQPRIRESTIGEGLEPLHNRSTGFRVPRVSVVTARFADVFTLVPDVFTTHDLLISCTQDECVAFLKKQAQSLDLPLKVYHVYPTKPIVVMTWTGTQPTKPSILLNSHMDVVPVYEEKWTYPPFSAHMDEQGNIYARGSQDMKCVGIQYLEAIRRLKLDGQRCQRTIHISFVPDEEIGGVLGMKDFVHTADFKALNVGFALDEGVACPEENFYMFYGERSIWHVEINCAGNPGHGSIMLDNTAGEKLRVIIDRFSDFRASEKAKLTDPKKLATTLGDVTSVNLTKVWGGIQTNVIPTELSAMFDIRITPSVDHEEFEATIKRWCEEAGPDVTYSFEQKNPKIENTKLDDSNPYWIAFKNVCAEIGVVLEIGIFPGGTDSRFVRQVGIPALCFSPMNKTKIALHDHNEYLNKDIFLKGIEIYTKIIPAVANV